MAEWAASPKDGAHSGFELLAWDSTLFGFPVAAILQDQLQTGALEAIPAQLHAAGVRLAYVSVPATDVPTIQRLEALGGRLVDRKRRYRKQLLSPAPMPETLESGMGHPCTPEFTALARSSGEYSRFRTDPNIPSGIFEALYDTWIRRSLAAEIAEEVLVQKSGPTPVGLVSLSVAQEEGVIGLLAVGPAHRRQGVGRQLIVGAEAWCSARQVTTLAVVTQRDNSPACGLYTACGFELVSEEAVFHWWLGQTSA